MLLFFMFVPPQGQPGGRVGAAGSSIKEYNGVLYGKYADQVQQVVASDKDFAEFKQPRFAAIFNVFFVFWVKHKATRVLRNNSIVGFASLSVLKLSVGALPVHAYTSSITYYVHVLPR